MVRLASELTAIEDELRRDGTVSLKTPDVWGDGSLTFFIQEYERLMAKDIKDDFKAELQGFIGRSDQLALQSTTALGIAAGGAGVSPPTLTIDNTSSNTVSNDAVGRPPVSFGDKTTGEALGLALEPTEFTRQHSVFINFNQALRRRNMVGDNARAPGYAVYKFRIPVSVLPGRETSQGHAAVVNLRARLVIDEAHLREMFPRLVIAEAVDYCGPKTLFATMDTAVPSQQGPRMQLYGAPTAPPRVPLDAQEILSRHIHNVAEVAKQYFFPEEELRTSKPYRDSRKLADLRAFLFNYYEQIHLELMDRRAYETLAANLSDLDKPKTWPHAIQTAIGGTFPQCSSCRDCVDASGACRKSGTYSAAFILCWFSLQTHENMKQIFQSLKEQQLISDEDYEQVNSNFVIFFHPDRSREESVRLWREMIEHTFPVHVFALDPELDEQNIYDSFERRRLLQLALAINIANGGFGLEQRLKLSRQLELEMASIDLNRTIVGFTHGNDTFGWYFRPRLQSPPTESNNIAAAMRTLWSTGPTEHYDLKHRELEPGIRECEAIIVLPSIATRVAFDVTTNWERLTKPGATKRSYEEMISLGQRLHQLKFDAVRVRDQDCFRPGDYERMLSRIEQMDKMLSMQSLTVDIPFEYEVAAADLFSKGNAHLKPELRDFYGLEYLEPDGEAAFVFVTGKNFHPTLTHAIVGGSESHSIDESTDGTRADVEVVSRQLLRVKIKELNGNLSKEAGFVLRVATPAGISNGLLISRTPEPPSESAEPALFHLKDVADWQAKASGTGVKIVASCRKVKIAAERKTALAVMDKTADIILTFSIEREGSPTLSLESTAFRAVEFKSGTLTIETDRIAQDLALWLADVCPQRPFAAEIRFKICVDGLSPFPCEGEITVRGGGKPKN